MSYTFSHELPPFAKREADSLLQYPNQLDVNDSERLIWRVTGWRRVMLDGGLVKYRELFAWFEDHERPQGAILAYAFRVPAAADFVDEMDSRTQTDLELADVLTQSWHDVADITELAPLVELRAMWASPSSERFAWLRRALLASGPATAAWAIESLTRSRNG